MGNLFSVRVRKNPPVNILTKDSRIRKIIKSTNRETGWKALHSRPVMSEMEQTMFQNTKIGRKLLRISTGKALDMQEIYDKQKRAIIQKAMQECGNAETKTERLNALRVVFKQLGSKKDYNRFMDTINDAQFQNLARLRELE